MKWLGVNQLIGNKKINQKYTDEEVDEFVEVLYSNGYVYDPYKKNFRNLFLGDIVDAKSSIDIIKKNTQVADINQVKKRYRDKQKVGEVLNVIFEKEFKSNKINEFIGRNIEPYALLYSIVFTVLSIITYFSMTFNNVLLSAIFFLFAFAFLTMFIFFNKITEDVNIDHPSLLWIKYPTLLYIIKIVYLIISVVFVEMFVHKYWVAVIIVFFLNSLIGYYVQNRLSRLYWFMYGVIELKAFIKKNL